MRKYYLSTTSGGVNVIELVSKTRTWDYGSFGFLHDGCLGLPGGAKGSDKVIGCCE